MSFLLVAMMGSLKLSNSHQDITQRNDRLQGPIETSQDTQQTTFWTKQWLKWCKIKIENSSHLLIRVGQTDSQTQVIKLSRSITQYLFNIHSVLEHQIKIAQTCSMNQAMFTIRILLLIIFQWAIRPQSNH